MTEYSLDPENKKTYAARRELWKNSAQSLRNDLEYQDKISQRRAEWKKQHSVFDKEGTKSEINSLNSQIQDISAQIRDSFEKEKILEKKVYIDGTGTDEDMRILRQSATERKKLQEQVEVLNNNMLDKQEAYKNEAEKRILNAGIVEEIKLSKKMTPDTVDALEDALTKLKDKYGIMPKGVVYNPSKVPDATVTYDWLDDKIYISNRFSDINKYADVVKKSEDSLIEYREKSGIVKIQKERLKNAEKILSDKNIKGYEREKAILNKATAEIELNTQRMAVRENLMDTLIHEYGHFIHRHANVDYVQKSGVFGAKDLGGKLINGDWKYDINSRYSANAKIEAAKISKYATESPYETFAEGFLAKEKGEKIPARIAKVIDEAERKAGVKSVANTVSDDIIEMERKLSDTREGFKFINDKTFDDLTIPARKKGAVIIRGTEEAEEHLAKVGAAASNIGDVLVFRKDVCISEVLEETHHFEQNLNKMNNDKPEPLRSVLNEIDAKQYLLDNAEKYKIPRNEIELTKKQLMSYQKQLKEIMEE